MKESLQIPPDVWLFVTDRDGEYCQNRDCKNKYTSLTVHHIIPRSQGGSGTNPCNLISLCWPCHDRVEVWKHEKDNEDLCVTKIEDLMHREQCKFYDHQYKSNKIKCSHEMS